MLEMLMAGKSAAAADYFLHIDPSNQADGSTSIIDLQGRQTATNSGEVIVTPSGPNSGSKSLLFNSSSGARDYVRIANANLPNVLTGNFTMEMWFYQTNRTPGNLVVLLGHWSQATGQAGFILASNAGKITFAWGPDNINAYVFTSTATHALATWNHLAVTRNNNIFTFWLNGTSIGTYTSAGQSVNKLAPDFVIGAYQNASMGVPDSSSNGFNGMVTGLKCYKNYVKYTGSFTPSL